MKKIPLFCIFVCCVFGFEIQQSGQSKVAIIPLQNKADKNCEISKDDDIFSGNVTCDLPDLNVTKVDANSTKTNN